MVDRKVTVTATMDASGMVQGAKQAEAAVERVGKAGKRSAGDTEEAAKKQEGAFKRMAKSAEQNERAWTTAGTAITAFGLVTVGSLAASAKAAVDWETSFAGVMKTVDDSAAGYATLSDELREMARTLPASHAEIAGVAEAAGQLGIAREDITAFTRTMIDLGETTNLTADEAATGIAQIANVMGTAGDDIDNFGATLVALGNAGASTESEILALTQRLAGASQLIGATEADALALANAMASVGIEAQLGGGSMSRAMIQMNSAVLEGGQKLEEFAKVSGMTSAQFAAQWNEDPVKAIQSFVAGLGGIQENGGDAAAALADVGLKGTENAQVFLRLSGASDMLNSSLALSKTAWEENTALTDEAAKRYETVASQLQVFRNNVSDAALSLGQHFLPALSGLSAVGSDAARWLGGLPDPMQKIAAWSGAAAGGTTLLAGGFLLLAPRAMETYRAFEALGIVGPKTTAVIKRMATALTGPWGIAIAAAGIALGAWIHQQAEARADVEELTATLDEQTGALTENSREWMAKQVLESGMLEDARRLGAREGLLTDALMGQAGAREELNALVDEAIRLGDKYAGSQEDTFGVHATNKKSAEDLRGEMERLGLATTKAQEQWALYNSEVASAEGPAGRLALYAETQVDAFNATAEAAERVTETLVGKFIPAQEKAAAMGEESADEYAKWVEAMSGIDASFIDVNAALQANEAAARKWAEGVAEDTADAEDSWEDYVANATFSLDTFLAELEKQVAAQSEWETNMLLLTGRLSEAAIQMISDMGPAGAQAAAALVDGTDEELARFEAIAEQRGRDAGDKWSNAYADALSAPVVTAAMNKYGADLGEGMVREMAERVQAGELTIAQAIEEYDLQAYINVGARTEDYEERVAEGLRLAAETDAVIPVDGDSRPVEERVATVKQIIADDVAILKIAGDDDLAQSARLGLLDDINDSTGTVDILGDDDLAQGARLGLLRDINDSSGTVDVYANTNPAARAVNDIKWWIGQQTATITVSARYGGGSGITGGGRYAPIGFMAGGYTGDVPTYEPAGIVHGQEFVSTASTTADPYNRQALEFMHSGRSIREWAPAAGGASSGGGGRGSISVNVPVHTTERADPNLIGAAVAWQVGGLP